MKPRINKLHKTHVIDHACEAFGIAPATFSSKARRRTVVYARYATAFVLNETFGLKPPVLGRILSIDRTTVLYAFREKENLMVYSDFKVPYSKLSNLVHKYINSLKVTADYENTIQL
jgi:chromosomal replication initiation ATPase DnaA